MVPKEVNWLKHIPTERPVEAEAIMETKVVKKTRGNEYLEYLVKWRGHPTKDSTWMSVAYLENKGYAIGNMMSRSS